ncbi:MAG: DUF2520 domain-containing protein [Acidobacteria bacterium]|nr:DUF2520 domain-containing protein [Acidobacteriota bacterium]
MRAGPRNHAPGVPAPFPDPVVIVGRGRVGNSLASALASAGAATVLLPGHPPKGKAGRTNSHLPGDRESIGLMVLCVPDDALRPTARRLSREFTGRFRPGAVVLHPSGALCAAELDPFRETGCHVGSWHPLQTFPEPGDDHFDGIRVAVEGDAVAVETGERLARLLGARPFHLPRELKVLYHALCTLACSHVAGLMVLCHDGIRRFPDGIRDEVWQGFLDLARNALRNLDQAPDPRQALTGPAVRGDRRTVERHLKAMGQIHPLALAAYEVMDQVVQAHLPAGGPAAGSPDGDSEVERALRDHPELLELLRHHRRRSPKGGNPGNRGF